MGSWYTASNERQELLHGFDVKHGRDAAHRRHRSVIWAPSCVPGGTCCGPLKAHASELPAPNQREHLWPRQSASHRPQDVVPWRRSFGGTDSASYQQRVGWMACGRDHKAHPQHVHATPGLHYCLSLSCNTTDTLLLMGAEDGTLRSPD